MWVCLSDRGNRIGGRVLYGKTGEVTALVGPSGGGENNRFRPCRAFLGYWQRENTVGGMDIAQIEPETLLSLYSIVFQDVTLFNNTILENIRIGRIDATDEEVMQAARLANCEEFALKLPDGYNSMIGEKRLRTFRRREQRISLPGFSQITPQLSYWMRRRRASMWKMKPSYRPLYQG